MAYEDIVQMKSIMDSVVIMQPMYVLLEFFIIIRETYSTWRSKGFNLFLSLGDSYLFVK